MVHARSSSTNTPRRGHLARATCHVAPDCPLEPELTEIARAHRDRPSSLVLLRYEEALPVLARAVAALDGIEAALEEGAWLGLGSGLGLGLGLGS